MRQISESIISKCLREAIGKFIEEDAGGGATSCANVMQTGSGTLGNNPEAGQYTVPLGADTPTKKRNNNKNGSTSWAHEDDDKGYVNRK